MSFAVGGLAVSVKLTPPVVQSETTKVTFWPCSTAPELQPVMVAIVLAPEIVIRTTPEPLAAKVVAEVSVTG